MIFMQLSAEKVSAYELCPRRFVWTSRYPALRVSLLRALYVALDAGLRTEKEPERAAENELLAVASRPGLDVLGENVYAIAMHHAKLAGILAAALRSAWKAPWTPVEPITLPDGREWHSGAYRAEDGHPRRIALVDRWTDDRKQQEITGWRTVGEACALNSPILLTAVVIGASQDRRRHSAWTRCYRHPRNRTFRFKRKGSGGDFGATWEKAWREDAEIPTADWLARMREDDCMRDLIHTTQVPVPAGRDAYLSEVGRIGAEMDALPETPSMRLAGCHGFAPCPFLAVCPDTQPERYGFKVLR